MAIEQYGIKEELLMENAGESTYFVIKKEFPDNKGPFVVVCGIGNNGGDGFVIARKLYSVNAQVIVFIFGDPEKYKGAARLNYLICQKCGIPIYVNSSLDFFEYKILDSKIVIDAIFGTGLDREVTGIYKDVIDVINSAGKKVVSVDIPSGLNGDNSQPMPNCVKADITVTYGLPKYGNVLSPGFSYNGKLYVSHISFPPQLLSQDEIFVELNRPILIPERPAFGHKGIFGDVLFIGGAKSYYGAPLFASLSFLKSGGGYSRLAAPQGIIPFIATKASEVVFVPLEEGNDGTISHKNLSHLLELTQKVEMLVIGPGLGISEDTRRLLFELLEKVPKPVLVDGDGITLLAKDLQVLKKRTGPTILTPHPGEMARLLNITISQIAKDPINTIRDFSMAYHCHLVYKVARSIIVNPQGQVFINVSGNSGMGTAGSGDVLTGVIASQYCLSKDISIGVRNGVFLHGLSGDIAAEDMGEDGITASTIMETLPLALKAFREGLYKPSLKEKYSMPVVI